MSEQDFSAFGRMERDGWAEPETVAAYASGFATATEQCVPVMVDAVRARGGSTALDLCCGHGIIAKGLHEANASVTGLDFSPAMLDLARDAVPGATFLEGDATDLPFDDTSFDAVTMGFGILHIPDSKKALTEARRILKPGGRFAYSVWHGPELSPAFRIVFGAVAEHGDPTVALPPGPAIHDYADPDIAFPVLAEAGFSDPVLTTADCHWVVADPATPVDHFMQGTVRGAHLLRSQPADNLAAIRAAVGEAVRKEFGPDAPFRVPIPAAIVSAVA